MISVEDELNNIKLKYKFFRHTQKIRLREIADYMNCSISLISKYENNVIDLSEDKIAKYTFFINNYEKLKEVN